MTRTSKVKQLREHILSQILVYRSDTRAIHYHTGIQNYCKVPSPLFFLVVSLLASQVGDGHDSALL